MKVEKNGRGVEVLTLCAFDLDRGDLDSNIERFNHREKILQP
jgi:hypothetical protein